MDKQERDQIERLRAKFTAERAAEAKRLADLKSGSLASQPKVFTDMTPKEKKLNEKKAELAEKEAEIANIKPKVGSTVHYHGNEWIIMEKKSPAGEEPTYSLRMKGESELNPLKVVTEHELLQEKEKPSPEEPVTRFRVEIGDTENTPDSQTKLCPFCSKEIDSSTKYCNYCGEAMPETKIDSRKAMREKVKGIVKNAIAKDKAGKKKAKEEEQNLLNKIDMGELVASKAEEKKGAEEENREEIAKELKRAIHELPPDEQLGPRRSLLEMRFVDAGFIDWPAEIASIDFSDYETDDLLKVKKILEAFKEEYPRYAKTKELSIYLERVNHFIKMKGIRVSPETKFIKKEDTVAFKISKAENFDQLFAVLYQVGHILGSQKNYDAEELKDEIEAIRKIWSGFDSGMKNEVALNHLLATVTSRENLRNKVKELLTNEGLEEEFSSMTPESPEEEKEEFAKAREAAMKGEENILNQIKVGSLISYEGENYKVTEKPKKKNDNRYILEHPSGKPIYKLTAEQLAKQIESGAAVLVQSTKKEKVEEKMESDVSDLIDNVFANIKTLKEPKIVRSKENIEAARKKANLEKVKASIENMKTVLEENAVKREALLNELAEIEARIKKNKEEEILKTESKPAAVEQIEVKTFSTDFIKEILKSLLNHKKIKEIGSLELKGVGSEMELSTKLKVSIVPFMPSAWVDIKATIQDTNSGVGIKDYKVEAYLDKVREGVEDLIVPRLSLVQSLLIEYIEKEEKKKVEKIWIEDGNLKVEFQ